MSKSRFLFAVLVVGLLITSCAPTMGTPIAPTPFLPAPTQPAHIQGTAVVQSVEIQTLANSPLQVNAIARGHLPDAGCTKIASANQTRLDNTFQITLTITTDPLALCAQALTTFEHVIALEVNDLPPATYNVNVNGVEGSFQVIADMTKFKQTLVEALNARTYDVLKTMMGQSLMIALYRSEGSAYEADAAIEQLKLNHLSTASPIIADSNKDLTALLNGMDPLAIFGLDVGPNHALFVSGWGLDGKDEAILYANYRLDGSLYWHGVLVAKGGFAQSNGGVDASVHETSVQYVMALQDVTIYNGPGANYSVSGSVFNGQIAKVTGTNSNGSWWRVLCPDDSVGSCWVSADPNLTQPTTPPQSNQPPPGDAQPTHVQFVMAQQDVSIYSGPSTQYNIIGSIADGQTAKVTGVSVDGNWWRVMCPDDTVGSCWVSANPSFTRPAQAPG